MLLVEPRSQPHVRQLCSALFLDRDYRRLQLNLNYGVAVDEPRSVILVIKLWRNNVVLEKHIDLKLRFQRALVRYQLPSFKNVNVYRALLDRIF